MDRFASLKFKVHLAKFPLDREFPELFRLSEFKKIREDRSDWDRVVRYIVYLYDPGSPLIQEFQNDLKERKEAAAIEAGYIRRVNGAWEDSLVEIMAIKDKDVYYAIMAFLKIFKNHEWVDIVVTEQELFDFQRLRFAPIDESGKDIYGDAKKKDGMMVSAGDRRASLKILYGQFYGDNKDVQAAEFEEMITPENAERILKTMPAPYVEV